MGETLASRYARYASSSFSILERIDVGETCGVPPPLVALAFSFSILERIDVGETMVNPVAGLMTFTFSILERIDVGETNSYSFIEDGVPGFQYPRTDRRG